MRSKIVAGNWKMNKTLSETGALLEELSAKLPNTDAEVIVAPTFIALSTAIEKLNGSTIQVAAQNMHYADNGAFTGEIAADMLLDAGITTVILGHSERRSHFGEDDALLSKKVKTALDKQLRTIFCFGELLEDRKGDNHFTVVGQQLENVLFDLPAPAWANLVLAYEPVWAIGTGETASPEQAQEMHAHIRKALAEAYGQAIADDVVILYGGSVKPNNAQAIFSQPDVDGGLIGGASLQCDDFIEIIKAI